MISLDFDFICPDHVRRQLSNPASFTQVYGTLDHARLESDTVVLAKFYEKKKYLVTRPNTVLQNRLLLN